MLSLQVAQVLFSFSASKQAAQKNASRLVHETGQVRERELLKAKAQVRFGSASALVFALCGHVEVKDAMVCASAAGKPIPRLNSALIGQPAARLMALAGSA